MNRAIFSLKYAYMLLVMVPVAILFGLLTLPITGSFRESYLIVLDDLEIGTLFDLKELKHAWEKSK